MQEIFKRNKQQDFVTDHIWRMRRKELRRIPTFRLGQLGSERVVPCTETESIRRAGLRGR